MSRARTVCVPGGALRRYCPCALVSTVRAGPTSTTLAPASGAPASTASTVLLADRRVSDRRSGVERRSGERRKTLTLVKTERRAGGERRRSRERREDAERRSGAERRTEETAAEHIRNALQLVAHVAESGALDDELRRDLDAAMFRLRFAIDQLEQQ